MQTWHSSCTKDRKHNDLEVALNIYEGFYFVVQLETNSIMERIGLIIPPHLCSFSGCTQVSYDNLKEQFVPSVCAKHAE